MNISFALSLVNEWERLGITDAVLSPGSRSTPIALALGRSLSITCHVVLDERSAGFMALGIAKVSGRPTIVVTTSGTAAANLRPSVTEAFHSGIPLIVITSDRPLELHKVGAPQTMEQEELFSDVVLYRASPSVPDEGNRFTWRALACRLFFESTCSPVGRGPVHANLAFREPLLEDHPSATTGRPQGRSWYQLHNPSDLDFKGVVDSNSKVLVIAGGSGLDPGPFIAQTCLELGWPLISDVISGSRLNYESVVVSFEATLRSRQIADYLHPDVIVLLGSDLASRTVNDFVSNAARRGSRIIRVSSRWQWQDPLYVVSDFYFGSFESFVSRLNAEAYSRQYLKSWVDLDLLATAEISAGLEDYLSEPAVAAQLYRSANPEDLLFASSSMPIRDLEWFAPKRDWAPSVYANRGVNGIDGVVSSFLGAMIAHRRVEEISKGYLLIGDLALRHELGALPNVAASALDLLICVIDNDGGGIFSFLPQASSIENPLFEKLFGTPQPVELVEILSGFGIDTSVVDNLSEFRKVIGSFQDAGGVKAVIVRTSRFENANFHRELLANASESAEQGLTEK